MFHSRNRNWRWHLLGTTPTSSARRGRGITASIQREDCVPDDFATIEGAHLCDLRQQPQALDNTLANLQTSKPLLSLAGRLNQGRLRRVWSTGMGAAPQSLLPL